MDKKKDFEEWLTEFCKLEMIFIQGGRFLMGSEDADAFKREAPEHWVNVPDFWCSKYPVTQAQWKVIVGTDPSYFTGTDRPVESISWHDTQQFIQKLNAQTGKSYRLLTEAEWEYAARGGKNSSGYKYAGSNDLEEVGWYRENSHKETKAVGLKRPNELGLYDMSGNVYEWVADQWHSDYKEAPDDGSAWIDKEEGAFRVIRGGYWDDDARYCRVSDRINRQPVYRYYDVGFRLAVVLQ